jgi:hypothetical protein
MRPVCAGKRAGSKSNWEIGDGTRNVTINRNLTQLRFERPEPELELGQKNNSPSKQLSKRDRNDWGDGRWGESLKRWNPDMLTC